MPMLSVRSDGIAVEVSVRPRAGRCRVRGICGGRLRIEVTAAPEGGEATKQALATLAGAFKVPVRDVSLLVGAHDRHKVMLVKGLSLAQCEQVFPVSEAE